MRRFLAVLIAGVWLYAAAAAEDDANDPYLWLEGIDDPRALAWVEQQNAATAKRLRQAPEFPALYDDALTVLDSASRLPDISAQGAYLYNLWRDREHPRGIFRRTTPAELRNANPHWETVLDVDALAKSEGRPWTFGDVIWRPSDAHRCLIRLSPGGGDAAEIREFDLDTLSFVPGGFVLPVAKSRVEWAGADAIFVATDFGPGSLTTSGYPRLLKLWRRGTPLTSASLLHEAPRACVSVSARRFESKEADVDLVTEELTFWESRFWQRVGGRLLPLAIPASATVQEGFHGRLVLWLKENWAFRGETFPAGTVLVADPALLRGEAGRIDRIVTSTRSRVVTRIDVLPDSLLVTLLDDVRGRLVRCAPTKTGWNSTPVSLPDDGTVRVVTTNHDTGDAWVQFETFTTPPALYALSGQSNAPREVRSQTPTFDGSRFSTQQLWVASADGTRIPYFVVGPKGMPHNGRNPVWMFSYGGFENALTPSYSGSYEQLYGAYGKLWLERGGVFVLANIRGGGEFGPNWHTSALKENHPKAFEDFEAVARDLTTRKITSPAHLGIEGRSNGGLLVASTMLRHPELYGAVVCGSPLLDMRRYHRLLAGASWMAEYGNPDQPSEWSYLSTYSPYQNLRSGMKLPPIMFYTSTRDDRVHPGHARKMAAKMMSLGCDVEYLEITEGGHHASVTNEQLANRVASTFTFLWEHVR